MIMNTKERIFAQAKKESRTVLTEVESKEVLKSEGIETIETSLASSKEQAVALGSRMGYPVVMKEASPDISHK
jgi:acyl-CoA synthetase (NDP forming)